MRRARVLGHGLLALGAVLLGAALAVRLFLAPSLVVLPLDQATEATASGTDVTYLDFGTLEEIEGAEASVRLEVEGAPDSAEASDDVAVWSSGTVVEDRATRGLITASEYTTCLDRREAVALDCDAESVNGDPADVEGLTVTFPFGTEQREYDVWNATTGQAFPARFVGEEEIEGLTVYRFEQEIPDTVIRSTEVPAALAGASGEGSVEADVVYSNVRTLWVEPTSGVVVTSEESPDTRLVGPDGTEGATVLRADIAADEETVAAGVDRAVENRDKISLIGRTIPLAVAGLGLLLVIAGIVLLTRSQRGAHRMPPAAEAAREPVSSAQ
jgi:hypothetical protein